MSTIIAYVGEGVIYAGLALSAFGVYALLRLDKFYSRLVITSKVETMGFLTLIIGAIVVSGVSTFSVKLFVILVFELITLPVGAHAIARSAYRNGFRAREGLYPEKEPEQ
ncbi:MAG: cation:proton antiporter [Spirochaetaceae bacterium]